MKTTTVALIVVGALVAGFVGGIVAGFVLPDGDATLVDRVKKLEDKVAAFPPQLRVAYVDAEGLFLRVFLTQVQAERQPMLQKQDEIRSLQARYLRGEITQDRYQQQAARLQAELLQAQLGVDLSMLDKMIASPGFVNLRADLERIREQARPIRDDVQTLVQQAQLGIVNMEGFLAQYQQLQSAFQQLDQLLTQVAAAKIVEISQQVAKEGGYDIVLRQKDVLIHRSERVVDVSTEVERRLWNLFPARS